MPIVATNVLRSILTLDASPYAAGMQLVEGATDRGIRAINRFNAAARRREKFETGVGGAEASSFTDRLERAGSLSETLAKAQRTAGVAAVALAVGMGKAVQAAGRMEQIRIAFRTLFGGAQQAEAMLAKLQKFDAESPFDFEASVKGAQRLKAMGFAAEDIIPTMEAAGNAVSAVGGGSETFDRVLLALGQIRTKGKASAEEINQLAEAGIPAYEILQQKLGLTKDQIGNLGAAGIDSKRALDALTAGMNEKFGGAMIAQSQTLQGRLSTLNSELFKLGAALGEPVLGPLTSLVKGATDLLGAFNSLPQPIKDVAGWAVLFATVGLAGISLALKVVSFWTDGYIKKLLLEAAAHDRAAKAAAGHARAVGSLGGGGTGGRGAGGTGTGTTGTGKGGGWLGRAAGSPLGQIGIALGAEWAIEQAKKAFGGDPQARDQSAGAGFKRAGFGAAQGAALGFAFGGPEGALIGGLLGAGKGAIDSIAAGPLFGGKGAPGAAAPAPGAPGAPGAAGVPPGVDPGAWATMTAYQKEMLKEMQRQTALLKTGADLQKQAADAGTGAVAFSDVSLARQLARQRVVSYGR